MSEDRQIIRVLLQKDDSMDRGEQIAQTHSHPMGIQSSLSAKESPTCSFRFADGLATSNLYRLSTSSESLSAKNDYQLCCYRSYFHH